ncbi:hypothetical protein HDIA_3521 [Hartmannibacter diazotrophicus]|uniref:YrhK domain-containing protein n=1 Tax=Hartmannibacter diazotrophicus TaxID=1482074 RepID=A0A2C9D9S0_9HYPH|nr:YrhK family protein [Hartmannibacter diazotrophicus]SON57062.1 hypothetical protein HDIA_3521 [Hartmannibacter diazotrophicus]
MQLFHPDRQRRYQNDTKTYAIFELAYTSVDLAAAILFIVGSVMFFYQAYQTPGTWCFLVGSIFFAMKPTLRITREFFYLHDGDYDDLARRLKE